MRLTPIDIQQQQFRRSMRGLDRREVNAFLDLVAQQLGDLSRNNAELQADLRRTHRELEEYREREATLKEAMLTAQRAIDEIREQAQKEARLIVSEAEVRSEKILHDAHSRSNRVLDDIKDLKEQRTRAIEELRGILNTHQKLLGVHDSAVAQEAEAAKVTILDRVRPPPPPKAEDLGVLGSR